VNKKNTFITVVLGLILLGLAWVGYQTVVDRSCSKPTRIILVRHGQTSWNEQHILQGNADIPLDEVGIAEAETLAQELADKDIDAIFSSRLSRAHDTALAIAALHGLDVHINDNLREIGLGIYTGYQGGQIPEEMRVSWASDPDISFPSGIPDTTDLVEPQFVEGIQFEGESLNMAAERSWQGIRDLAQQHCGKNIVVATHGGIIKIALTQVNGLPVTDYSQFSVANGSQTVLEFEPDGSVVVLEDW